MPAKMEISENAFEAIGKQNRESIAMALKVGRVKRQLTQQQLAERAGVTPQTVCKIEKGSCNVSLDTLSALMAVLGLKMIIE